MKFWRIILVLGQYGIANERAVAFTNLQLLAAIGELREILPSGWAGCSSGDSDGEFLEAAAGMELVWIVLDGLVPAAAHSLTLLQLLAVHILEDLEELVDVESWRNYGKIYLLRRRSHLLASKTRKY